MEKDIDGEALYGLVGYPLSHSFSKKYFTDKFRKENINARYLNFEIDDISLFPSILKENSGLRGLNVTIPYKQSVIDYLDKLSPEAEAIGAVNVISVSPDLITTGHNTDADGFAASMKRILAEKVDDLNSIPTAQKRKLSALVLGTGGASRAVVHALTKMDVSVFVVSRFSDKGDMTYSDVDGDVLDKTDIIVNATPLGMYPANDSFPSIDYSSISPRHICFDLIYNPLETQFMKRCRQQDATVSNGLEMLYNQAELAWKIWKGKRLANDADIR